MLKKKKKKKESYEEGLFFDDLLDDSEIGFELDIVTPGGLDRRIKTLDDAWNQLASDVPENVYIASEYLKWKTWSDSILESSWFSKTWASGILNELDEWKTRYNKAYSLSSSNAPTPFAITKNSLFFESPLFWVVAGLGIAAGIYYYAGRKR